MACQVCVYWSLPIRASSSGWYFFVEFFIGLSILHILGDAWFFAVHHTCHRPRQPTPFAGYYISKYGHLLQEHALTIPVMIFLPVPLSSWYYYQYAGSFGSMLQHANFVLTA